MRFEGNQRLTASSERNIRQWTTNVRNGQVGIGRFDLTESIGLQVSGLIKINWQWIWFPRPWFGECGIANQLLVEAVFQIITVFFIFMIYRFWDCRLLSFRIRAASVILAGLCPPMAKAESAVDSSEDWAIFGRRTIITISVWLVIFTINRALFSTIAYAMPGVINWMAPSAVNIPMTFSATIPKSNGLSTLLIIRR